MALAAKALVMVPVALDPVVAFGFPNAGWLNRFAKSARNPNLDRSENRFGKWKSFASAKSSFQKPGPRRMSRPELPNVNAAGATNADVSNQCDSFWPDERTPLPSRLGNQLPASD